MLMAQMLVAPINREGIVLDFYQTLLLHYDFLTLF